MGADILIQMSCELFLIFFFLVKFLFGLLLPEGHCVLRQGLKEHAMHMKLFHSGPQAVVSPRRDFLKDRSLGNKWS